MGALLSVMVVAPELVLSTAVTTVPGGKLGCETVIPTTNTVAVLVGTFIVVLAAAIVTDEVNESVKSLMGAVLSVSALAEADPAVVPTMVINSAGVLEAVPTVK